MLLSTLAKHKRPSAYQRQSNRFAAKPNFLPDIAWKTGTSWGFRDAWAVGISGDYILAVWVGNFDGKANPSFKGFEAAGPILFDMLAKLVQMGEIDSQWRIENAFRHLKGNIKTVSVCQKTGDLNEQGCPKQIDAFFIPGKSPIKSANVFRPINIDLKTGLRACDEFSGKTKTQYFEVWPNDIRASFDAAGINIEDIPDYHPHCKDHTYQNAINLLSAPKITSPANGQTFIVRLRDSSEPQTIIALKASVDGGTKRLNWFVNDRYIGSVQPQETLFYTPTAGIKVITLSDDQGQVVSTKITIEAI
jgi:penicillin-binding protein 1C